MFIEALFTIARTWEQPNYPLTEEWVKTGIHINIYNGILFNCKKNEIMPFAATRMDIEIFTLSKVRQRKTNI